MATKHNILTALILPAIMLMSGCTIEEMYFADPTPIDYRGEPVEAFLDVSVGGLLVSTGTRADEADLEDSEAERWVNDLWVFQYNASTGIAVADPIYVDMANYEYDQSILEDMPVTLSDNEGDESVIYVVTNTGDKSWGSDSSHNTVEGLLASALPTREPIFFTDTLEVSALSIPMEGDSGKVKVVKGKSVRVPVSRMYAKIMIDPTVDIYIEESTVDDLGDSTVVKVPAETVIYSVSVGNIPLYCRVGSLGDGGSTAATYPDNVQWVSRAFDIEETADGNTGSGGDDTGTATGEPDYRYIVYLPENLQGQVGDPSTSKIADSDAPSRALQINIVITYLDPVDQAETNYPYTVYPGANSTDDYNVKRNNIYRVKVNINELSVARVPSANCFFAYEGHTISFYPYYRVETGGGYDFTDYLDPYGAEDAQTDRGAKIDHVGIVWQTEDCIGDNSDGNLVYFTNQYGAKITSGTAQNGYEQIHVIANKEGNALIAAYDTQDNILWSWHIWVRNEAYGDPTHPSSALVYYTYQWDETQIYHYEEDSNGNPNGRTRVSGYEVMRCNLGSLQDEPVWEGGNRNSYLGTQHGNTSGSNCPVFQEGDGIVRTFGMMYQWGRKDPFPPLTTTLGSFVGDGPGTAQGGTAGLNTGYYVHDYSDEHTQALYGNDNKTEVHKTSYDENGPTYSGAVKYDSYLFHSHIHETSDDGITGMRYSIAHPTVFLCGTEEIARSLDDVYRLSNPDSTKYVSNLNNYLYKGGWSDEDEFDAQEWGSSDPSASTKVLDLGITDDAGREIYLYDDYGAAKSIFDPCPYGWRVSSGDLWLGFAKNGVNLKSITTPNDGYYYRSSANYDDSNSCLLGLLMYMGDASNNFRVGEKSWFPSQGFLLPDGCGYRVGGCGNYVNANADSDPSQTDGYARVYITHLHDNASSFKVFETQMHYTVKSTGSPLRCIRDQM